MFHRLSPTTTGRPTWTYWKEVAGEEMTLEMIPNVFAAIPSVLTTSEDAKTTIQLTSDALAQEVPIGTEQEAVESQEGVLLGGFFVVPYTKDRQKLYRLCQVVDFDTSCETGETLTVLDRSGKVTTSKPELFHTPECAQLNQELFALGAFDGFVCSALPRGKLIARAKELLQHLNEGETSYANLTTKVPFNSSRCSCSNLFRPVTVMGESGDVETRRHNTLVPITQKSRQRPRLSDTLSQRIRRVHQFGTVLASILSFVVGLVDLFTRSYSVLTRAESFSHVVQIIGLLSICCILLLNACFPTKKLIRVAGFLRYYSGSGLFFCFLGIYVMGLASDFGLATGLIIVIFGTLSGFYGIIRPEDELGLYVAPFKLKSKPTAENQV